ncbi:hypothetical protein K2X33_12500 [bacterium]|nr:hypothetical protein [bacterium]
MQLFKQLELCREELKFSGQVTLGIHSNALGADDFIAGHAWLSVETSKSIFFLGLWPDNHPDVIDKREECADIRFNMEVRALARASRYYRLSPSQVTRLNQYINKPAAWGYMNNCSDWATEGVKYVLGHAPSASDHLIFNTPRSLGEDIERLEKMNPTSPRFPREGEIKESSLWR